MKKKDETSSKARAKITGEKTRTKKPEPAGARRKLSEHDYDYDYDYEYEYDYVAGWECPLSYYGLSDGCDCDCGIWDPDCDADNTNPYGCIGGTCELNDDGEGVCSGEDYDYGGSDNYYWSGDYYDYYDHDQGPAS